MLKKERHMYIMDKIEKEGKVIVTSLKQELHVTEDTIRKDLQELSSKKLIRRVHGGALSLVNDRIDFSIRINKDLDAKEKLAEVVVSNLVNESVIFIDGGSTNLKIAEKIPYDFVGRILTNSPAIAIALSKHPHVQINMLGGEFDKESQVNTGATTITELEHIFIDLCILGVSTIDSQLGITSPKYHESQFKTQLIKQSSRIITALTNEKLEKVSTFFIAKFDILNCIVAEKEAPNKIIDSYRKLGVQVLQAQD